MRNVGSADGEAWKIPVFQVIHRPKKTAFSPLALKSERLSHQIPGDRSRKRRLESYVAGSIPVTVSFNPGAFEAQIHYVSRP